MFPLSMNQVSRSPARRILYISPPWPYRSIRSLHIAKALQHVGEVDRVVVHTDEEKTAATKDHGEGFKVRAEFSVHPRRASSRAQRFTAKFGARAPFPHGIGVNEEDARRLTQLAGEYDLTWVFKFRTANMFPAWTWPRAMLDIDDLPSGVWRSVAESGSTLYSRLVHRVYVMIWQRRERLLRHRFSTLAVCSEADRRLLPPEAPVHVIPNGFTHVSVGPPRQPALPVRIGFMGMFNYDANAAGVQWFISECWPRIRTQLPDARLRLVGNGSDGPISRQSPGIDGLGWVEDSAAEIATWSMMVVPLHKGGGTRQKIAESFSRKCPVVSTRLGAYGYEVTDRNQLRLADTAESFANACVDVARNPAEAAAMAERASADFIKKWSWDAIAPRVWTAAEDCLRRSR